MDFCPRLEMSDQQSEKTTEKSRKVITRYLDILFNLWIFMLKFSGICPLWNPVRIGAKFKAKLVLSYSWMVLFMLFKVFQLFGVAVPLRVSKITGTVDSIIETIAFSQVDVGAFLCSIAILYQWRGIRKTIERIRSFESTYFTPNEPWLSGVSGSVILIVFATTLYHLEASWDFSLNNIAEAEAGFCADRYGIMVLKTNVIMKYAYFLLSICSLGVTMAVSMLCFTISLTAGQLFYRIRNRLLCENSEKVTDRPIMDLASVTTEVEKLSKQMGFFILMFYFQSVIWVVWIICYIAGNKKPMSTEMQVEIATMILVMQIVVTFSAIYLHEQGDASDELQHVIDQQTDADRRMKLFTFLHRITHKPVGLSLAGTATVNRAFLGSIIGAWFTYGTFFLQLKENRDQVGGSPVPNSSTVQSHVTN